MTGSPQSTASHIGICVEDLERSRRFYIDGLGCTEFARFDINRPISEVDSPCRLSSIVLKKDGFRYELVQYHEPGAIGAPATRRNQLGLTHLSFLVDDVDATARELERHGGTIIEGSRSGASDPSGVQIIFLADPDGIRIALMRLAAGQDW